MCNYWVRWVNKRTVTVAIEWLSLHDDRARDYVAKFKVPPTTHGSILCIKENQLFTQSEAVLQILLCCRGYRNLVPVLRLLPLSWRNTCYDFVARYRHRFNKVSACSLPVSTHSVDLK